MSLAVTAEQIEFGKAVSGWAAERDVRAVTRRLLDGDDTADRAVQELWQQIASFGWTGLLVAEEQGGSGATWVDAALVVEALGAACGPLPLVSTTAVSSVLAQTDGDDAALLQKGIADGSVRFGTALGTGERRVVVGGAWSTHVAVLDGDDVLVHETALVELIKRAGLDASSGTCEVVLSGSPVLRLPGSAAGLKTALLLFGAADSVGVATACLTLAVEHAKVREAFGRVIGSFQAVKHHCANMLLSSQLASAATWRAAAGQGSPDEAALVDGASFLAGEAGLSCAKTALQVLGGIGFTWEHDLHLYLRRAGVTRAQAGPAEELLARAGQSLLDDARPRLSLDLPAGAEAVRSDVRAFRDRIRDVPADQRHANIVDEGYLHPQWPAPWGRGAGPLEQLVIEEELADVDRVSALGPTFWEVPIVLPTILEVGTPDQVERWMRPSMIGDVRWCQLYSEPSAGSDLAALRTRAVRVDGGWSVTGQKVWTSDAHHATLGLALVRTNPDVPKHKGITCLVVDMHAPGVEIRPLRQINGDAHFNEVFLDDVFVPDADVVGPVDGGWGVARITLGHERVSLGGGSPYIGSDSGWVQLLELARRVAPGRPAVLPALGRLTLTNEGAAALSLRSTYRALLGRPIGIEGSIGKTVAAEVAQPLGDLCLDLLGDRAAFADGDEEAVTTLFLRVRAATIAGGTSEVLRNLLAEQALGLPREPLSSR